jgi:hypothetical protein
MHSKQNTCPQFVAVMRFISPKQIAHSNCGPLFSLLGVGVLDALIGAVLDVLLVVELEEGVEEIVEVIVVVVVVADSLTPVISRSSGSIGEGGSSGGEDPPPNSFRKCERRDSN